MTASTDLFTRALQATPTPPSVQPTPPPSTPAPTVAPSSGGDLFTRALQSTTPKLGLPGSGGGSPAIPHKPPTQQPDIFRRALEGESRDNPGKVFEGAMNTAGNYMDIPLAYAEAAGHAAVSGDPSHFKQIWKDLTHAPVAGGGAANVAQNDIYFRQGSLHRVLEDPSVGPGGKQTAQWLIDHPWVAAGADFATELVANPTNYVGDGVGEVANAVTRIPRIERMINEVQTGLNVGDRLAPMRLAEMNLGAPRGTFTQAGAELLNYPKLAQDLGRKEMQPIYKGLSDRDDILEVTHRQQGNKVKQYADPAQEADIEARGRAQAGVIWRSTNQQMRSGALSVNRAYGHTEMYPGVFDEIPALRENSTSAAKPNGEPLLDDTGKPYNVPFTDSGKQRIAAIAAGLEKVPDDDPYKAILEERAAKLKQYWDMPEPPPEAKVLYFPMSNSLADVGHNAYQRDFLAHDKTPNGSPRLGIRMGSAGQNKPHRTHPTLLDYQSNIHFKDPEILDDEGNPTEVQGGLRPDWEPASALYGHVTRGALNSHIADWEKRVLDAGIGRPKHTQEPGFIPFSDTSQRQFGSRVEGMGPSLKDVAVPGHFVNFLKDAGATNSEAVAWDEAQTIMGKLSGSVRQGYGVGQNLLRQGIVFNPIVHLGWNLIGQYIASGGDIHRLPYIAKNIMTDLARSKGGLADDFESVIPHNSTHAERSGAVLAMGAPREFGDEESTARAMRPMSSLPLGQKAMRVGQTVQRANSNIVFEVGERHIAIERFNQYYKSFRKRGMSPEEATAQARTLTRQALGNYSNVSNLGLDKYLNGVFFFYPWLKTLLPFWLKTGIVHPQSWNAPRAGIQTSNELRGDPNARTSGENPYAMFTGFDKNGYPQYFEPALPGRILEQFGNLAMGLGQQDPKLTEKGFESLLMNRMNPVYRAGAETVMDTAKGGQQPFGLTGYAPPVEKLKHAVGSVSNYVPGPVQGMAALATAIHSGDRSQLPSIAGQIMGGFGYTGMSSEQKMRVNKLSSLYYRGIDRELAMGNKDKAWQFYQALQNLHNPSAPHTSDIYSPTDTGAVVPHQ
jgi:hypothetical protein